LGGTLGEGASQYCIKEYVETYAPSTKIHGVLASDTDRRGFLQVSTEFRVIEDEGPSSCLRRPTVLNTRANATQLAQGWLAGGTNGLDCG
jgi:hypothetical protein